MPRLWLGLLAGLVYGALSAASMIPLSFPNKRAALTGAVADCPGPAGQVFRSCTAAVRRWAP
jgi:hypothetical protein